MGANTNAYTTDDHTAYHLKFTTADLAHHRDRGRPLPQNPRLPQDRLPDRRPAPSHGEARRTSRARSRPARAHAGPRLHPRTPTSYTTIGFERRHRSCRRSSTTALTFFKRFYRPENVVLVIAGDFCAQAHARASSSGTYGGWARATPRPPSRPSCRRKPSAPRRFPTRKIAPHPAVAQAGDAFDPANKGLRRCAPSSTISRLARRASCESASCPRTARAAARRQHPDEPRPAPLHHLRGWIKQPGDIDAVRDEIYQTLEQFKTTPVDAARPRSRAATNTASHGPRHA